MPTEQEQDQVRRFTERTDFVARLINEGYADPLAASTIIQRPSTPDQMQKLGTRRTGLSRTAVAALPSLSVIAGSGGHIKPLNDTINALKVAIGNAQAGDVIDCSGLTFVLGSTQIVLKTGVLIEGGIFKATPPKQGNWVTKNCFAFVAPSGARDFGFRGSSIESSNGVIYMEGAHANFVFTRNRVRHGYDGSYYSRLVIFCGNGCDGAQVEDNDFIDSLSSDRTLEIWGWSNVSYSYNRFHRVNDGGHIMEPGHNFRMIGNRFVRLRRMGAEIQQTTYPPRLWCEGLQVVGNVIESRENPYWDSMGFSVPVAGKSVTISDNYIRNFAYDGKWPTADGSGKYRGSYGIEAPNGEAGPGNAFPHKIERNILISERDVAAICSPGIKTPIKDNQAFGPFAWGVWIGEPGNAGPGSVVPTNCTHNPSASSAPPIPGSPVPPDPGPTPMPPTLTSPSRTSTSITVAAAGGTTPYKLSFKTRDGTDTPVVISTNWTGAAYEVKGLTPNWVYTFFSTGKDGAVARLDVQCLASDPVTTQRRAIKIVYDNGTEQVI